MIAPVDEKLLNQFSFHPEAQLFVDGNGLGVVVVHNEINLVQNFSDLFLLLQKNISESFHSQTSLHTARREEDMKAAFLN